MEYEDDPPSPPSSLSETSEPLIDLLPPASSHPSSVRGSSSVLERVEDEPDSFPSPPDHLPIEGKSDGIKEAQRLTAANSPAKRKVEPAGASKRPATTTTTAKPRQKGTSTTTTAPLTEQPPAAKAGTTTPKETGLFNASKAGSSEGPNLSQLLELLDLRALSRVFLSLDFVDSTAGTDFFAVGIDGGVYVRKGGSQEGPGRGGGRGEESSSGQGVSLANGVREVLELGAKNQRVRTYQPKVTTTTSEPKGEKIVPAGGEKQLFDAPEEPVSVVGWGWNGLGGGFEISNFKTVRTF